MSVQSNDKIQTCKDRKLLTQGGEKRSHCKQGYENHEISRVLMVMTYITITCLRTVSQPASGGLTNMVS